MLRCNALRRQLVGVMLTALVLPTAPAHAQETRSADHDSVLKLFRSLVDEAFARKADGELTEALAQFQLALTAIRHKRGESWNKRRYGVMYQRIRILMALKRFKDARNQLAVMKELPGLSTDERTALRNTGRDIERLSTAEALKRPVSLLITVEDAEGVPLAAVIRLQGESLGRAPTNLSRPPGDYRITAELKGYLPHQGTLHIAPNKPARHIIVLKRPEVTSPPDIDYAPAFATGGVGLSLLIVGGVLHGFAHANFAFADTPGTFRPDALKAVDQGKDLNVAALAMYGVGGAAVVTAVVLAALASDAPSGGDAATLHITPSQGNLMVGVGGRW